MLNCEIMNIIEIYKQAWQLIRGCKAAIWVAMIVAFIILMVVVNLAAGAFGFAPKSVPPFWFQFLFLPVIVSIIMAPFLGGINQIAIAKARGMTVALNQGFKQFDKMLPLTVVLLVSLLVANVLPMISAWINPHWEMAARAINLLISLFFIFSIPLVVDQEQSVGQALINSAKMVRRCYGKILFTYIGLLVMVVPFIFLANYLITLNPMFSFIGALFLVWMIWYLPFSLLVIAIWYLNLLDKAAVNE